MDDLSKFAEDFLCTILQISSNSTIISKIDVPQFKLIASKKSSLTLGYERIRLYDQPDEFYL
jgi:hypothetical protein